MFGAGVQQIWEFYAVFILNHGDWPFMHVSDRVLKRHAPNKEASPHGSKPIRRIAEKCTRLRCRFIPHLSCARRCALVLSMSWVVRCAFLGTFPSCAVFATSDVERHAASDKMTTHSVLSPTWM